MPPGWGRRGEGGTQAPWTESLASWSIEEWEAEGEREMNG